ncbi:Hypothetical predicted protein [Marmota monax]|uniref:Uncharacterized protein n=1 Tax=Marmota monax TaxID=9995 RepID=A0A5E4CJ23_MARMO|nr:Hypothetical predicted protein [Marmota monax]
MAGHQRERVIQDEVHQNQFLREQYLRELRTQKLCTDYHVNPLRKGQESGLWAVFPVIQAMAGYQRKREIQDEVHQNQFLREQYLRELRMQKLCTEYHVNPLRKAPTDACVDVLMLSQLEQDSRLRLTMGTLCNVQNSHMRSFFDVKCISFGVKD